MNYDYNTTAYQQEQIQIKFSYINILLLLNSLLSNKCLEIVNRPKILNKKLLNYQANIGIINAK